MKLQILQTNLAITKTARTVKKVTSYLEKENYFVMIIFKVPKYLVS